MLRARFLFALLVGGSIAVVGALALERLDVGGLAWYGLLLLAGVASSLVDRERFYGPSEPARR